MKMYIYLSGIIALSAALSTHAMEQGRRPEVYKMIDASVINTSTIDWPAVFAILDLMKEAINVNEYLTSFGTHLLYEAVVNKEFLAAKTLLEKYHANPNIKSPQNRIPLVTVARIMRDTTMADLLLFHGAQP